MLPEHLSVSVCIFYFWPPDWPSAEFQLAFDQQPVRSVPLQPRIPASSSSFCIALPFACCSPFCLFGRVRLIHYRRCREGPRLRDRWIVRHHRTDRSAGRQWQRHDSVCGRCRDSRRNRLSGVRCQIRRRVGSERVARTVGLAPGRSGTASGGRTHATAAHNTQESAATTALAANEGPSAVPAGSADASNEVRSRSLPALTPSRAWPSQVNHVQTHTRVRISHGKGGAPRRFLWVVL